MSRRIPAKPRHLTRCRRRNLFGGGQPFTGLASIPKDLLDRVLQIDHTLELIQIGGTVHCYRRTKPAVTTSDDILVHQFQLKYPPGEWLIECLHTCDTWKRFGSREKASREVMKMFKDPGEVAERDAMLRVSEISESLAPEITRRVDRGYKVFGPGK
jgi:hypothetical protein